MFFKGYFFALLRKIKKNALKKSKNVVLNFPYKDCILEGGQSKEEQSLKEFFYNETLANDEVDRLLHPKVFTNIKKYGILKI